MSSQKHTSEQIKIQEGIREIPLTQGKVAIVDASDYEWLSQWKWHAHKSRSQWYAARSQYINGKNQLIRMHREIICAPDGIIVDHINRNSLDNRRENLRLSTHRENLYNSTWYDLFKATDSKRLRLTASRQMRHGTWTVTVTVSRLDSQKDADLLRGALVQFCRERIEG